MRMELLLWFLSFDEWLFFQINNLYHSPALDWFFLFFSFYPLIIWLLIGLLIVLIEERKDTLFIFRLTLALFLAGGLSSIIIKPLVARPRPDISHGNQVIIVPEKPAAVPFNNNFAFPSGHAAVAFAGAYIVSREESSRQHKKHSKHYKKIARWLFFLFAALTAFSRIYLGKHYPLDVFVGALLGVLIGFVTWRSVDFFRPPQVY